MKKFTGTLEKFDSPLWGHHIMVPTEIATPLLNDDRRVVCRLNGKLSFQCALMPKGNGQWFITINKSVRDELDLQLHQPINVQLEKDNSTYGLPMTEELEELLIQDEEGNRLFHSLTPGKQRNLIYIAGQVKNPEKRLIRAHVIVEHLKIHNGKIDFKALGIELKLANKAF